MYTKTIDNGSVQERPARAEVLQRARPAAEQVAPGALVLGPRRQREGELRIDCRQRREHEEEQAAFSDRCCTGARPRHRDLTRANLASATPRNKSIARINETHLSFCAVYRVPSPSVPSASDTLGPFFWFAGRALAICARSEPETRSGSQQLRKKDEGQLSPTSNGERAAALPRQ